MLQVESSFGGIFALLCVRGGGVRREQHFSFCFFCRFFFREAYQGPRGWACVNKIRRNKAAKWVWWVRRCRKAVIIVPDLVHCPKKKKIINPQSCVPHISYISYEVHKQQAQLGPSGYFTVLLYTGHTVQKLLTLYLYSSTDSDWFHLLEHKTMNKKTHTKSQTWLLESACNSPVPKLSYQKQSSRSII